MKVKEARVHTEDPEATICQRGGDPFAEHINQEGNTCALAAVARSVEQMVLTLTNGAVQLTKFCMYEELRRRIGRVDGVKPSELNRIPGYNQFSITVR